MTVIEQNFSICKTHLAINYTPTFPSPVQRVMVFREMARALLKIDKEILVEYKDGRTEPHKFSEFEGILQDIYRCQERGG